MLQTIINIMYFSCSEVLACDMCSSLYVTLLERKLIREKLHGSFLIVLCQNIFKDNYYVFIVFINNLFSQILFNLTL